MAAVSYEKYFDIKEVIEDVCAYLPNFNRQKFLEAFEFAEKAHRGQMRKDDKTPYIAHPVEVVKILAKLHADEDTLISAILHDVPEDTNYTLGEIKLRFGQKVAFLVDGITKLSKVHYQNDMPQRQVESLKKLFLHSGEDLRVILIKLADRLHNMQTLGNVDEEKRMRIAGETLEIYVPIANLLGIQETKSQLEDLCFRNLFPLDYDKLQRKLKERESHRVVVAKKFMDEIKRACEEHKIEVEISKQKKGLYSVFKKISAIGKSVEEIDDRIGIKIVAKTVPECYQVLGIIHGKFVPINDRFRDYIANPKSNGYQSLHTTVFGSEGVLTEVQIKTEKMDFDAEYGIAANFFDENVVIADEKRSNWVNKILEIEKNQKTSAEFLNNIKADIFEDRIFAFTPKGTPIDLPKGATALDFAYSIHTDVGNHAEKADINGKITPINVALKTGDVVKILINKKVTPELAWMSLVKTNMAKGKILEYFKRVNKNKKVSEGLKILQKDFDIAGLGFVDHMNFKKVRARLKEDLGKDYATKVDLYAAIAEGEVKTSNIVRLVEGPYFEKNQGQAVRITLRIVAKNRFGLLRDISEVLYKNALDMYSLKGWASKYEVDAFFNVDVLVPDLETVSHIFDELEQVEGVTDVYRISNKGLILFTVGSILTIGLWTGHAFILKFLSESSLKVHHPLIFDFIIYFTLLCMTVGVLYMRNLAQKYFPFMRNKKLLWIISFIVPIVATVLLFVEMVYFNLELSWLATMIEVGFVYAYLLINYMHFTKTMKQI